MLKISQVKQDYNNFSTQDSNNNGKPRFLGQVKPTGTTNTLLYAAPSDRSASLAIKVANDGTASTFDVALKDYDQKLTLDASTYKLHKGDVVTAYKFTLEHII